MAVGHRVVHGGLDYSAPVLLSPEILERLERFVPLAPLHQPHNLAPIRMLLANRPDLPQVACFDTAFHRGQSELAQAFALPPEITERGVRRYGFHGLSYEYIASVLPRHDERAAQGRTVVLHLGNGVSACAIQGGQSVATTMGLTGVEGLMMGTRSGSLDPGVLLYLMDELQMDARAIEKLIYKQSGLLGVSGVSSDMRTLLASDGAAGAVRGGICSSIASAASWARWPPRWAGSTHWCSPPASASMPRRSGSRSAAPPPGSASPSIPPSMPPKRRGQGVSAPRTARWRSGPSPPTKS